MKAIVVAIGGAVLVAAVLATGSPISAAQAAKAGNPVKGLQIFTNQKCELCHAVNGKGGKLAPDLGAVGTRRDAASLAKFLVKPTPIDPKHPPALKMEAVKVKGQDLEDLIAYLVTLKGKK